MSFGVYVHVPYCRQICPYCDFAKFEIGKTLPPPQYAELVRSEIRSRASAVPAREMTSIYFGGGTPSAVDPSLIVSILRELANAGLMRASGCEATIEIDPATLDERALDAYVEMGFNRFSVGLQSFDDRSLKVAGRQHDGASGARTLGLLSRRSLNYSFDLLFGLPAQTLADVRADARRALEFAPPHMSAYLLTVPEAHPMQRGRAPDGEQAEMFDAIESEFTNGGLRRYEISNFARPGRESRHNVLHWTDRPYWGLGLGAHSYLPIGGAFGARFWNPSSMAKYSKQILSSAGLANKFNFAADLPANQLETLRAHQALTDFLHTSLRQTAGFAEDALHQKFAPSVAAASVERLQSGLARGWLEKDNRWRLTREGRLFANLVFEHLTFLEDELPPNGGLDARN